MTDKPDSHSKPTDKSDTKADKADTHKRLSRAEDALSGTPEPPRVEHVHPTHDAYGNPYAKTSTSETPQTGKSVTLQVTFTPENPDHLEYALQMVGQLGQVTQVQDRKAGKVERDAYGNPYDPSADAGPQTRDAYGNPY